MRASKMGIKGQFMVLIGGALTSLLILAFISNRAILSMESQIKILGLQRIPISENLGEIRASANAVPRFMWLSLAQSPGSSDRNQSIEKVSEYWDLWQKSIKDLSSYPMVEKAKQKTSEMQELMPEFKNIIDEGKKMLHQGQDLLAKDLLMKKMPPVAIKLTALVREISQIVEARNKEMIEESQREANQAQFFLLMGILILGGSLSLVGYIFSSRLSKQLFDIIEITNSVSEASFQVSSASAQLSNAANQLSSISQNQASATEQTSASLTEISGMIESNVEGSEKANELTRDVYSVSEDTKKSMEELTVAMKFILESNGRIEQLVKVIEEIGEKTEVIDDIVFKTQLLSFNASVEAERAGEHGRGFAVVAQEVGNLAQMSGKAATEIASIVKQSIKEASSIATENKSRVEKGGELASETGEKMGKALTGLSNILEATSKIVAASKEQSQGVGQISTSVDGINQSTQEIASTSEESASASEELLGQAQSLLSLVSNLRKIVTGNSEDQELESNKKIKPKMGNSFESPANVVALSERTKRPLHSKALPLTKKAVGSDLSSKDSGNDEWEKL